MPTVTAQGKTFECKQGENLRRVLLQQGVDLHNQSASVINCRGIGTCGTCAVTIEGEVSDMSWREKARLSVPPHSPEKNLEKNRRLACQVKIMGDVKVSKDDGFWGQGDRPVW
ncbi:MAG: 2Fe-2S iron-sulfur cluster binding domain-containing protein [Cyanobacteria bacterium J06638_20]